MKIKDILAKLRKGETLTEAEQAFLDSYDPDQATNDAAAAARRKAEERATAAEQKAAKLEADLKKIQDEAEAEADKGKPELEKANKTIERLTAQLAERDTLIKTLNTEKGQLTREQKLTAIIQKSGIAFIPKVNAVAMAKLLKDEFAGLDLAALDDDSQTKPILDAFRTANEAIIADTTGHGSGGDPAKRMNTFQGKSVTNPWKKDTFNLTLQGQITAGDPDMAKRLKTEAGIKG